MAKTPQTETDEKKPVVPPTPPPAPKTRRGNEAYSDTRYGRRSSTGGGRRIRHGGNGH